jgi:hypothetical protein
MRAAVVTGFGFSDQAAALLLAIVIAWPLASTWRRGGRR